MKRQRKSLFVQLVDGKAIEDDKMNVLGDISRKVGQHGDWFKVAWNGPDGELKERSFNKIVLDKNAMNDPFNECSSLIGVKITKPDGTFEYGFRFWDSQTIMKGRNARLVSLYVKDGEYDEKRKRLNFNTSGSDMLPMWIQKALPFWNEKMKDWIGGFTDEHGYFKRDSDALSEFWNGLTLDDCVSIKKTIGSDYVSDSRTIMQKELVVGGKKKMVSTSDVYYCRSDSFDRYSDRRTTRLGCNLSEGALNRYVSVFEKNVKIEHTTFCYSYLKSMYVDSTKTEKVFGLIPVSDLLMITTTSGKELWNNLDQTVKGYI